MVDQGRRGGAQLDVVGEGHDAQGGGEHHPGAAPFEQRGQFVAAPVGGDRDGEAG